MKLQKYPWNLIYDLDDRVLWSSSKVLFIIYQSQHSSYVEHAWKSEVWNGRKIHRMETNIQAKCYFVPHDKCPCLLNDHNQNYTFCSACADNARCIFVDINWIKAVIQNWMYFALRVKCPSLFTNSNHTIHRMQPVRGKCSFRGFRKFLATGVKMRPERSCVL